MPHRLIRRVPYFRNFSITRSMLIDALARVGWTGCDLATPGSQI